MTNKYHTECCICKAGLEAGKAADLVKYGSAWEAICPDCLKASGARSGRTAIFAYFAQWSDLAGGPEDDRTSEEVAIAERLATHLADQAMTAEAAATIWANPEAFWQIGQTNNNSGGDVQCVALVDAADQVIAICGKATGRTETAAWLAEVNRRFPQAVAACLVNTDDGYHTTLYRDSEARPLAELIGA